MTAAGPLGIKAYLGPLLRVKLVVLIRQGNSS